MSFVTILILIDGFLQYSYEVYNQMVTLRHNPYFNRWFSAIQTEIIKRFYVERHNPYFNRWFSAIKKRHFKSASQKNVTILILIDGFLQYRRDKSDSIAVYESQSLF